MLHHSRSALMFNMFQYYCRHMIKICSGITRGRVLNGELYVQRLQKLIYLHSSTDCFMKISLQSTSIEEKSS